MCISSKSTVWMLKAEAKSAECTAENAYNYKKATFFQSWKGRKAERLKAERSKKCDKRLKSCRLKGLEELEMVKNGWKGEMFKVERDWNTWTVSLGQWCQTDPVKGHCGCRFSFQPSKNTADLDQVCWKCPHKNGSKGWMKRQKDEYFKKLKNKRADSAWKCLISEEFLQVNIKLTVWRSWNSRKINILKNWKGTKAVM